MNTRTAKSMIVAMAFFAVALCAPPSHAQTDSNSGADTGGHEIQIWTGGGRSFTRGGAHDTNVWNVGGRFGWVLTEPHGPSVLRGRFEYTLDFVPIFWVFQPGGTAYGFGVNPLGLKWDTVPHGSFAPYMDITGGALFTNRPTPEGASRANFTTSLALGSHFLRRKYNVSAEVRFMHISNAGIKTQNLGINTLQGRIGFGLFTRGH